MCCTTLHNFYIILAAVCMMIWITASNKTTGILWSVISPFSSFFIFCCEYIHHGLHLLCPEYVLTWFFCLGPNFQDNFYRKYIVGYLYAKILIKETLAQTLVSTVVRISIWWKYFCTICIVLGTWYFDNDNATSLCGTESYAFARLLLKAACISWNTSIYPFSIYSLYNQSPPCTYWNFLTFLRSIS